VIPASSFRSVISRSAKPSSKATAAIVISAAMVASLALPASADTPIAKAEAIAPAAVAAPSAAQAPLVARTFGTIGFTGVVKPKPKPKLRVVVRQSVSVSRSTTRAAISPTSTPTQAPASGGVLAIAASLAGIYYIYGGTTPAGFDCSGFTEYVFNKVGINLPRTAEEQRQFATPVSNPQPGDLVFFGAPAYHTGIYAGNGMLWDSAKSGSKVSLRDIWTTSGVTYGRP